MNLHLLFASLAAALSLGTAAQAVPTKVACVGDSITFGSGLKPGDARYPQVLGTLMGPDFDVRGFGNPGKTAAIVAAAGLGCGLILPPWPADAPPHLSDFNDLRQWREAHA